MRPREWLGGLLNRRWAETQQALGPLLAGVVVTWDIGAYDHFKKKRGYGVTFPAPGRRFHLRFASKCLAAPPERVDGVVRHEIGHVVDLSVPRSTLDNWAASRLTRLPSTPERRADAVAEAIWQSAIKYDSDEVQNTKVGSFPRPAHLGR